MTNYNKRIKLKTKVNNSKNKKLYYNKFCCALTATNDHVVISDQTL